MPLLPFINHQSVQRSMQGFVQHQMNMEFLLCTICYERKWPDNDPKGGPYICGRCHKQGDRPKWGKLNGMYPYDGTAEQLKDYCHLMTTYPLNEIEKMLIAQSNPIMKVYYLKGNYGEQNLGFSGNVINIRQSITKLCKVLPHLPSSIKSFIVRRKHSEAPNDFRDFKVRSNHLRKWLQFLKANNPLYK